MDTEKAKKLFKLTNVEYMDAVKQQALGNNCELGEN